MRSQATFLLMQTAREILLALVTAGSRVAGLLTEKYPPPEVDGQPLVSYDNQVKHLKHELESAEAKVVAAEDEHMKKEVVVSRRKTERDEVAADNHEKLVATRQGLDGLQGGKAGFETVFVKGTSPKSPLKLEGQLEQSVTLLREPAVEPRKLRIAGFEVNYSTVADDLESGLVELRQANGRLDLARKEAEASMLNRRESIDELRGTVIWAGRSSEGLFHRAGEQELAKRIRSSTSRPARASEQQAAAEEESPAGDSESVESVSEPSSETTESQPSVS